MEGFRDVVRYSHELAILGGQTKKCRGEAMRVPRRIAQAKRKPHRDAPGRDLWGEWFSPKELCHDVGEREESEVQVLLGRSGTQEDAELMAESLVVEIERRAVPEVAILQGVQLQSSEVLNYGVEDGGANGSGWNMDLLQFSLCGDDEV
jgi:hypothetical protein